MTLRGVGAGLGRTGTTSLKAALEFLFEAPCYHMDEVYAHPEHVQVWRSALRGDTGGLSAIMEGYAAWDLLQSSLSGRQERDDGG